MNKLGVFATNAISSHWYCAKPVGILLFKYRASKAGWGHLFCDALIKTTYAAEKLLFPSGVGSKESLPKDDYS